LLKLANDESRHAGLFAVLNGLLPPDIYAMLGQVAGFESGSVTPAQELAKKVRALGLNEAADAIEAVAKDEGRHGQILQDLVGKIKK
jgi:rubrerythrin